MTDWIDDLPFARAHREARKWADQQGWDFWRDWHHALEGCCPRRLHVLTVPEP